MGRTVAVRLGSGIVYVYGTVNGAAASWRPYHGDVWQAVVPRAASGTYHIALEAYDEAGNRTDYETTLQYGFATVTDRGPGCYYNAEDLNRVGRAVAYLADLLRAYGYDPDVHPRTDWTIEDVPDRGDMLAYLGDIRALLAVFCVLPTTPEPPESMERLGYQGANAIEQILVDMYLLVLNMCAAWLYCGEMECGEV